MLNKNHRIFENTVHSDSDILLLESLHLKFINESRIYRPNSHADYYYANVPKRETLKHSDFNDYDRIKLFFYSDLEKGYSNFGYNLNFLNRQNRYSIGSVLSKYNKRIGHGLENNKPIVFRSSEMKGDIKHVIDDTFKYIKLDIKRIRHYTGFYAKDTLDLAPVRVEFACPLRNFIYLFDKKLLLNGKEW